MAPAKPSDRPIRTCDEPIERLEEDRLGWHRYLFALLRRLEARIDACSASSPDRPMASTVR
jgi:hypothetical protein